jgi:hypothetical protein
MVRSSDGVAGVVVRSGGVTVMVGWIAEVADCGAVAVRGGVGLGFGFGEGVGEGEGLGAGAGVGVGGGGGGV